MKITSNFDSGNIKVIKLDTPDDIQVEINSDHQSDFYQWFHFRLQTQDLVEHTIHINNAHGAAYVKGWENYRAVASYDRQTWFRVDTKYDGQRLTISHVPEENSMYFAYFAPYSYERHMDLLHEAQQSAYCQLQDLGESLDGNDICMLVIGEPSDDKKKIWITARQHPGESMAEWFVEGMLTRLLDEQDGCVKALLAESVIYIIPNMNPDGSIRGHLRTNACGANLNREWLTPSMTRSPEVYLVREKMLELGLDVHLDIHGDEALPYNFVAGSEGVPNYTDYIQELGATFKQVYQTVSPEFQDQFGYGKVQPGAADLSMATNWIANQFKTLSFTIEMPFKDNIELPDQEYGWSDIRSSQFGYDVLPALLAVVKQLQD